MTDNRTNKPTDDREAVTGNELSDAVHAYYEASGKPANSEGVRAVLLLSRAVVPDAAKQPEGWSTEDRQESKQEAERRWSRPVMREAEQRYQAERRYQAGCVNGFMLGAEWQKARETFISYKTIADEARAERDAAVAAIERVKVILDRDDFGDDWEHDEWVYREAAEKKLEEIEAALDGAPEPEVKP